MEFSKGFGSDNHASVHPEILKSLSSCNEGHAHSYGLDEHTLAVEKKVQELFGPQASCFFVYNGTAANILALKACNQTFSSVLCSDISHINVDECGGPEVYGGYKLIPLPTVNGKIKIEDIQKAYVRKGDQHFSQVKTISLTQPTELGTCYSLKEIQEITSWAHKNQLYVHMDGARFANACHYLNCQFRELTTDSGVDVLSFGGTKNGLMMGEMVIFLNPKLSENFKFLRKQFGQLPSKSRYIAAQFKAYLHQELWKEMARKSCSLAQLLEKELKAFKNVQILYPVESNALFVKFPKDKIKELRKNKFFYIWDENDFSARLMMSWDSEEKDIYEFIAHMKNVGIN